jgi:hypothetical protein
LLPPHAPALRVVPPPHVEPPETPATLAPHTEPDVTHGATQGWSAGADRPDGTGLPGRDATPLESTRDRGLSPDETNVVADAFSALLAAEQGEPGARPVRFSMAPTEPIITDAFLDAVARRVVERLGPDVARALVADIVSDVAERLVKEEIERIRKKM